MRMLDRFLIDGYKPVPKGMLPEQELDHDWILGYEFGRRALEFGATVDEVVSGDLPDDVIEAMRGLGRKAIEDVRAEIQERLASNEVELARLASQAHDLKMQELDAYRSLAESPMMGVFQVDNVAEWVARKPVIDLKALPPVAPPRDRCWMEWKATSGVRLGAWVTSSRDDEWTVTIRPYMEADKEIIGPIGRLTLSLDERGRIVDIPQWEREDYDPISTDDSGEFAVVVQTLAFLNCHNIATDEIEVSERLRKRHQKRHGIAPAAFRTVRLVVPRKRNEGAGEGARSDSALHIVDGHFSHYGNCCPGDHEPNGLLFGKLEGVYWMPTHVRGSAERGEVQVTERVLEVKR